MKIEVKHSTPFVFLSWLLTLAIITTSISIPVNAQSVRTDGDAVLEESDADIQSVPEGLNEDEEGNIVRGRGDNFKSPQAAEQFKLRQEALKQKLAGKKSGKVHQVAKGQFVELELEKNDRVFVIIAEYGSKAGIATPTPLSNVSGPLHNTIAEPDRTTNNSTIWQPDYSREHYNDMYFNKMAQYYQTQSSGRYTINGAVTEWVKVPFNGPRYGSNSMGDAGAWTFIADAINTWTKAKLAEPGMTIEKLTQYLKTFDVADRYDFDKDGNFNEPDGYIDHFQIVHAGDGEETGGGALGADAIWSHRWFAWYNLRGFTGPTNFKNGGVEFGGGWGANPAGATVGSANASVHQVTVNNANAANVTNAHPAAGTGVWVGDYTIQPENGGLGVFAHEYGHDLGLPDHYDTTNAGTNSTAYWTIMSSGSYLGDGTTDTGTMPGDFGAWEKLQLGWLNYDQAATGIYSDHKLGPAETNTRKAQALLVSLPPEKNDLFLYDPVAGKLNYGTKAYWGGMADDLDVTMTRTLTVPAGASALNMRLQYNIENTWDYAYVSVSKDGGATWSNLAGTYPGIVNGVPTQILLTSTANVTTGTKQNLGNGITGSSGGAWRLASFNIPADHTGQTIQLRLRYKTDSNTALSGFLADEITFGGVVDGAENADIPWTLDGFKVTNGLESMNAPHYYIAEFRQYRTYDKSLETGPYTFGHSVTRPNWVTHYPYQDGLLISYWDTSQPNNNTSAHRGEGRVLPIDAHPEPLRRVVSYDNVNWTFAPWGSAVQSFDSTFGLEPTDSFTLPFTGTLPPAAGSPAGTPNRRIEFDVVIPSLPGVPVFNDMNSYWSSATPTAGVIVPKTGTTIRVVNTSAQGQFMQLQVNGE